jgi:hypothetical protein
LAAALRECCHRPDGVTPVGSGLLDKPVGRLRAAEVEGEPLITQERLHQPVVARAEGAADAGVEAPQVAAAPAGQVSRSL